VSSSAISSRGSRAGKLFVITGPSGVGKGTLISRLRDELPGLDLSVSATTRAPREGERAGVHYHFMDTDEFDRHVAAGDFLEHADYASHRYGTLRSEVEPRLARGESVVLEIELQGARQVRGAMPDAVQVFIAPPSPQALRERLEGRGTDSAEEIARRLAVAEQELAARGEFGRVIVNDDVDKAAAELSALVRAALDAASPNVRG
jgi:guanylate kinase